MFALITQGVGFGFIAGTSPGPMQSYLISTTLTGGWRRGIIVVLSPLVTDIPIILLMTFWLRELPDDILRVIQFAGGCFVLWLAWGMLRQWWAGTLVIRAEVDPNAPAPEHQSGRHTLQRAVMMNFLSPGPYVFWGSITGPLLIQGLETSVWHALGFLLAFYGTFLTIMTGMVFIFDRLRRVDQRVTNTILLVALVVLAGLGVSLIYGSVFP